MQFETEESHFEKAGLHPDSIRTDCGLSDRPGNSSDCGLGDRPGNSSVPRGLSCIPFWFGSVASTVYQGTREESWPPVDSEVACEPAPAPLGQVQEPQEVKSLRWQHRLFPTSVPLSGKSTMVANYLWARHHCENPRT